MEPLKTLGRNIKNKRKSMKLTQANLGFLAGLGNTQISALERGKRQTTVLALYKIAKALNTTVHELLP